MGKQASRRKRVQLIVNRLMIYGPKMPLAVRIDSTHTALYVRVSRGTVSRTIEVQEEVLADYDADGRLVAFEVIGFETPQRSAQVPASIATPRGTARADADSYELQAALA